MCAVSSWCVLSWFQRKDYSELRLGRPNFFILLYPWVCALEGLMSSFLREEQWGPLLGSFPSSDPKTHGSHRTAVKLPGVLLAFMAPPPSPSALVPSGVFTPFIIAIIANQVIHSCFRPSGMGLHHPIWWQGLPVCGHVHGPDQYFTLTSGSSSTSPFFVHLGDVWTGIGSWCLGT